MGEQYDPAGREDVWKLDLKAVFEQEDCIVRIQMVAILD